VKQQNQIAEKANLRSKFNRAAVAKTTLQPDGKLLAKELVE